MTTYMVGAYSVDLLNLVAERRGLVDEELQELVGSRLPRQQLKLVVDGARPRKDDAECNLRKPTGMSMPS